MYLLIILLCFVGSAYSDLSRTNMVPGRSTIVHLLEWKWKDIAEECERFLSPHGFGGVQVSPASENLIIHLENRDRPWYERYQVMSYKMSTRSGNEEDFLNMTRRCNKVGVRIYVDVVFNHMTATGKENVGTAGSTANFEKEEYYGVPYGPSDFHEPCALINYNNVEEVRNCQLLGLKDLNQSSEYVRQKIVGFLNELIGRGVAGYRVDAAKHMWPADLKHIYGKLNNLNTEFGFAPNSKPYIYHEVAQIESQPIKHAEYTPLGDVTEFKVGIELQAVFRGQNALKWLVNWGEPWNLSPSDRVLVFIDNHDTQRHDNVLTYKESRPYKAAIAFMLAQPYGSPRIMSSYFFNNAEQGPPADSNENILSPTINQDDTCGNGWVCEHRWRQIYQMVAFKNSANNTIVQNWWDNGHNQIAFSRGNNAFIVFNLEGRDLNEHLQDGYRYGSISAFIRPLLDEASPVLGGGCHNPHAWQATWRSQNIHHFLKGRCCPSFGGSGRSFRTYPGPGLPEADYCDVITGKRRGNTCTGIKVTVDKHGKANIKLSGNAEDVHLAIHTGPESSLK